MQTVIQLDSVDSDRHKEVIVRGKRVLYAWSTMQEILFKSAKICIFRGNIRVFFLHYTKGIKSSCNPRPEDNARNP